MDMTIGCRRVAGPGPSPALDRWNPKGSRRNVYHVTQACSVEKARHQQKGKYRDNGEHNEEFRERIATFALSCTSEPR